MKERSIGEKRNLRTFLFDHSYPFTTVGIAAERARAYANLGFVTDSQHYISQALAHGLSQRGALFIELKSRERRLQRDQAKTPEDFRLTAKFIGTNYPDVWSEYFPHKEYNDENLIQDAWQVHLRQAQEDATRIDEIRRDLRLKRRSA